MSSKEVARTVTRMREERTRRWAWVCTWDLAAAMSEGVSEVGGSPPAHDEHEAVNDDADVEEPVEDTHEVAVERGEVAETLDPGTHHQHGEALVEAKAGVDDDHPVQEGLALLPEDEVDEAAVIAGHKKLPVAEIVEAVVGNTSLGTV